MNVCHKSVEDIADIIMEFSKKSKWDTIALQEVGRYRRFRTSRGRPARGTATSSLPVEPEERSLQAWSFTQGLWTASCASTKNTAVWLQGKQSREGRDLQIYVVSAHAPGSIGHEEIAMGEFKRTLQNITPGKRTMFIMRADLNATLTDVTPSESDSLIGAAAQQANDRRQSNALMDMLVYTTRGLRIQWHNSYKRWWRTATRGDYQHCERSDEEGSVDETQVSTDGSVYTLGRAASSETGPADSSTTSAVCTS